MCALCSISFNLICNMTMGGGLQVKYLLSYLCNCDSHKFDMQHDHVLKKLNFDLLK